MFHVSEANFFFREKNQVFETLTDSRLFQGIPGNHGKRPFGFCIPIKFVP